MEITDTYLLEYLNSLPVPPGFGWKLYQSTTGRGWRLATIHPTSVKSLGLPEGVYATPWEAIEAEIKAYEDGLE